MNGKAGQHLVTLLVCSCVCALAIAVYDVTVRQPRTPRLAVVDIARLYAAADQGFRDRAIGRDSVNAVAPGEPGASAPQDGQPTAAERAGLRGAEDFGPALEGVLKGLSGECRCAIVAMAAVIGGDATVPDYTAAAARRLGLSLRRSYTE